MTTVTQSIGNVDAPVVEAYRLDRYDNKARCPLGLRRFPVRRGCSNAEVVVRIGYKKMEDVSRYFNTSSIGMANENQILYYE